MTARILVVDDIPANVKLLEARLLAEYFDVLTAQDGYEALKIVAQTQVDVILLDIMMPGIDGFEVCERLKADPRTTHIPVVMVTALDQPSDRVRGLTAGADDFLTKPVNDLQLIARVKSLVRFKMLSDELRARTSAAMGEDLRPNDPGFDGEANILVVDGRASSQERLVRSLSPLGQVQAMSDPHAALFEATENSFDLVIVNSNFPDFDPLRLCSQLRSLERTRFTPVLFVAGEGDDAAVIRALDLGVNDYLIRPIDPNELVARALTQVRRKRFNDRLRSSMQASFELAVTDGLTGLSNRRHLDTHLQMLFKRAKARNRPLSVLIADIDSFKSVNDTHGHDVGDEVLKEFANRVRGAVRGADLACRFGGEEFVVIMPDTGKETAMQVAERLRQAIETRPFEVDTLTQPLAVTASIGIASLSDLSETPEQVLKQADRALYEAKHTGKNRVVSAAA